MLNVALFLKESKRDLIKPANEVGSKKVTLAAHYFPYAIELFSKYKDIHGDLVIPTKYIVPDDVLEGTWPEWSHGCKLGMFAKRIRQRYRNNALADHLVQSLDELDFVWDLNVYNRKIALLAYQRYKAIYGNLEIPATFVVPNDPEWPRETWGKKLGALTINLRYHPEEYNAIKPIVEEMGLSIQRGPQPHNGEELSSSTLRKRSGRGTSVDKFEDLKQTLLTFKEMYGNLDIPYNFPIEETDERFPARYRGCNLGRIANNIRYNNQYKAYREELVAIGFPFAAVSSSSHAAYGGDDEEDEESDEEIVEDEEMRREIEIVTIPTASSSSAIVINTNAAVAAAAAVMAGVEDSDSEASQDPYHSTSAAAAAVAAAASLTALSKSNRSLSHAAMSTSVAEHGTKVKKSRGSGKESAAAAAVAAAAPALVNVAIDTIPSITSSALSADSNPEGITTEGMAVDEKDSAHGDEETDLAPLALSIDYAAIDETSFPHLSKREINKLKKFLALKEALLVYKNIYGHLSVPYHYAIPLDDERYSMEFRGKALGSIVNNIIYNRQYKEFEQELLSIGFTYEKPVKPMVQPLSMTSLPAGVAAVSSSSSSLALKSSMLESMLSMQSATSPPPGASGSMSRHATSTTPKRGRRSQYDLMKEALHIFVSLHGHADIAADYIIPETDTQYPTNLLGKPLGKWVQKVRKQPRKFTDQQKQELMDLGLVLPYVTGNTVWLGEEEDEEDDGDERNDGRKVVMRTAGSSEDGQGEEEEQGEESDEMMTGAASSQELLAENINTIMVESTMVVGNKPLKKRGRKRKSDVIEEAEAETE